MSGVSPSSAVACPVCGYVVNKDASGCPECGSSPRLSAAEAEAVRRARGEKGALVPCERPPLLPGWSRRVRAWALIPAQLAPAGVLIYGVHLYSHYDRPNIAGDSRITFAFDLAAVALLALVPALLAVLPRRLPLALAVAASVLAVLPAVPWSSFKIPWNGPLALLAVGLCYIPPLAVVRSILQGRADRREEAVRSGVPLPPRRSPALHVAKSLGVAAAVIVAVLFVSAVLLFGVLVNTWGLHTQTVKTSPDGNWSLIIDSHDEGALGGITSVELEPAKGNWQKTLLYDGEWLADSEVSWGDARTVFIGGRVINPFAKDGVTESSGP